MRFNERLPSLASLVERVANTKLTVFGYLQSVRWMSDASPWERCPRLQPWGPAVKRGVEGMFSHLWPCRPPWQVWSEAARRRSAERSSINLWSTTQTAAHLTAAAWSEKNQPEHVWWKSFVICFLILFFFKLFILLLLVKITGCSKTCHFQSNIFLYFKIPRSLNKGG